ncbi:hypothetical protein EON65_21135 [archaeon]|nr:MAG: hypothetical protein EON65_21135 [archaeon]
MRDGDKVVIFAASFPDAEATEACIQIHINAVRKAHRQARLGYVHPRHLTRGLSLASLKEGKGVM